MQVNISNGVGAVPNRARVDGWIDELRQARDEGFRRAWISQFPWEPDIMTLFAIALRELDGFELATSVLPIQVQHPMHLAQRALTLSMMSGGRFVLGLGLTHAMVTEGMWGIPWDKPIRRMNEYLNCLLPLLNSEGVDAAGETVTTRGQLQIAEVTAPPVYIAALKPQMLRVAGRRCAGTVTWMTGPKTLSTQIVPTLREAAEEAGRPVGDARVVAAFPVAVTDEVDKVRETAAAQFAMYGQLPVYRAMLDREGYVGPEDSAIIGDEGTVGQRIEELRSAGVDELVVAVMGTSEEERARTRALVRKYDSTD
jgi:5,10-methylenetetrahydromethanopterin reductase